MRGSSLSNHWVTKSQTTNKFHLKEGQRKKQGESRPSVPTMACQSLDLPLMTLITNTLHVVQSVGLLSTIPMVPFPSFDGNPNYDPWVHVQSFSNYEDKIQWTYYTNLW